MNPTLGLRQQEHQPAWLYAGLLAFVPHLLAVMYAAAQRADYSHVSQYLSELGERGAPSAAVANYLGILPTGLLFVVFGVSLARHYRAHRLLRVAGALIAAHGVCRVVAAIFVCDAGCRPAAPSASQLIHNGAAGLGFMLLTAAVFTAAAWLLRHRRGWHVIVGTYTLGMAAVASQVLLLLQHGGPAGVFQRVALGALQLGVSLLALHLLVRER